MTVHHRPHQRPPPGLSHAPFGRGPPVLMKGCRVVVLALWPWSITSPSVIWSTACCRGRLPLLTGLFWQLTVFTHFFKDELYESRIQ